MGKLENIKNIEIQSDRTGYEELKNRVKQQMLVWQTGNNSLTFKVYLSAETPANCNRFYGMSEVGLSYELLSSTYTG